MFWGVLGRFHGSVSIYIVDNVRHVLHDVLNSNRIEIEKLDDYVVDDDYFASATISALTVPSAMPAPSLPFIDLPRPFLDLPLPSHCLSLDFDCLSLPV